MTFLVGALIGLFAANCIVAYRIRRIIAERDLHCRAVHRFIDEQLEPAESDGIDIPLDGPPMVVIPMQQVYDELHLPMGERVRGDGGPRMTTTPELVPRCPCGAVARFVRRDRGQPEYKCVICVELWCADGLHPAVEEL